MDITRLKDVIVPDVFTPYVTQRTMEKSDLLQSGIISNTSEFDALAGGAGATVNMPYWNDLIGDSETIIDNGYLEPQKIYAGTDIAVKHGRAKAWGANGLSALLSGARPLDAIGDLVAEYWNRELQKILLYTLEGVFVSGTMSEKVHDISGESGDESLISGGTFIDAAQKMGDAKEHLTGVMMHSGVESYLAKRQLIEYVQEAGQSDRVPVFMNKKVISNDSMPFDTTTNTATAYLFGEGAIALGNGKHANIQELEIGRNTLSHSGEDILVSRKIFILHPRGVSWMGKQHNGVFPDFTDMKNGANWERVYETKAIRIVKFVFNVK